MSSSKAAGHGATGIVIIADDTDNSLVGGQGDDLLFGRGGDDFLYGDKGNDTLNGGDGNDRTAFDGRYGDYVITFDAGTGRYTVSNANFGTDTVVGIETFIFDDGTIAAGPKSAGATYYSSQTSATLLEGGDGDDSLVNDQSVPWRIAGGPGNDFLSSWQSSTAVFRGNAAEYTISRDPHTYQFVVSDSVAGRDGTDILGSNFSTLEFADRSLATSNLGSFYGTEGDDVLTGTLSNEFFSGSAGNDSIDGGGGIDQAGYRGRYAEYVITFDATSGTYTLTDKVSGRDGTDTLSHIENLLFIDALIPIGASPGGQVLLGTDASDLLIGTPGNDSLYGGKYGDDTLTGGAGNDVLSGGMSATVTAVYSGPFADYVITYDSTLAQYTITDKTSGRDGTDTLKAIDFLKFADITLPIMSSVGGQVLNGTNRSDALTGGAGNDSLYGAGGNDKLTAGNGNDVLRGGDGDDRLDAGSGDDWLIGSAGNDVLIGSAGNDVLIGRAGNDTAVYSGNHADYQIAFNSSNNTYKITDTVADRDGVDTLSGIENLQFADGTWPVGPTAGATALIGVDPLHGADIVA
ncbi:calcium-binding protein [Aquabacterium sp.]|uniref:calcium-binding protein n=1 Tax=Aquabacterium sp. TaxID=1872578 RepID=UPI00378404F9